MKRPFGITLLAIIFAVAGISYIMLGFQMTTAVTFGPVPTGTGAWIWGWLIVITGVIFWSAGLAAWQLQPLGWMLGMILAIFGLLEAFFIIIGQGTLNYAIAATGFPLLLLWYLNRPSIRAAFGMQDDGTAS